MSSWCKTCGGFVISDHSHKCFPQWRVWSADDEDPGADFENTRLVYASDAEEAAKKFAQLECDGDPDYYESYIERRAVAVRSKDGCDTVTFAVKGETTIEFYAKEV